MFNLPWACSRGWTAVQCHWASCCQCRLDMHGKVERNHIPTTPCVYPSRLTSYFFFRGKAIIWLLTEILRYKQYFLWRIRLSHAQVIFGLNAKIDWTESSVLCIHWYGKDLRARVVSTLRSMQHGRKLENDRAYLMSSSWYIWFKNTYKFMFTILIFRKLYISKLKIFCLKL